MFKRNPQTKPRHAEIIATISALFILATIILCILLHFRMVESGDKCNECDEVIPLDTIHQINEIDFVRDDVFLRNKAMIDSLKSLDE